MNQLIKSYLFIPSGFKNFIENGFEGWASLFVFYFIFSVLLAHGAAPSFKIGIYIFIQPLIILFLSVIFSSTCALVVGAKEPIIKGLRLTALCLPPIGLTLYFIVKKSLYVFFAAYPILLFIYGSAFLGSNNKILKAITGAITGMITIGLIASLSYLFAGYSDKWFGQELIFDGFKANLSNVPSFTGNEAKIYKFLLFSTPDLGYIPQAEEIADSLKMDRARVQDALVKLDEKGCIVLGTDREIRYAYPWAMYNQGYEVFVEKTAGISPARPVYAASALHALAITALFKDTRIRILSHLRDTGKALIIELSNQQISLINRPQVQVYNSDIFSEMEFYSSPSGAKASYRGRFDSTRLLSLDRAISVANELMQNKTAGLN